MMSGICALVVVCFDMGLLYLLRGIATGEFLKLRRYEQINSEIWLRSQFIFIKIFMSINCLIIGLI